MTIAVREGPDPLTRAAAGGVTPTYAESAALTLLRREIERYASGQTNGRSILVAGHRGAGKTTLIRIAVADPRAPTTGRDVTRPLLVPLHGPTLLLQSASTGDVATGSAAGGDPTKIGAAEAAGAGHAKETEQFLSHITLSLYRALAKEIAERYRFYLTKRQEAEDRQRARGCSPVRPWNLPISSSLNSTTLPSRPYCENTGTGPAY